MADDAAWDVVKLVVAAVLGGVASAYLQRILPRTAMTVALKADARGALRMTRDHIPQFDRAAEAADQIVQLVADGKEPVFEDVTALTEGWVITAPAADLLGHGQRFEEDEAYAVMKYLHYWNLLIGLEGRYRAALDQLLKSLPAEPAEPAVSAAALREYAVRVRDNARELAKTGCLLRAQADNFFANRIEALTPEQEERATSEGGGTATRALAFTTDGRMIRKAAADAARDLGDSRTPASSSRRHKRSASKYGAVPGGLFSRKFGATVASRYRLALGARVRACPQASVGRYCREKVGLACQRSKSS